MKYVKYEIILTKRLINYDGTTKPVELEKPKAISIVLPEAIYWKDEELIKESIATELYNKLMEII